jgi:hypothetical protein
MTLKQKLIVLVIVNSLYRKTFQIISQKNTTPKFWVVLGFSIDFFNKMGSRRHMEDMKDNTGWNMEQNMDKDFLLQILMRLE